VSIHCIEFVEIVTDYLDGALAPDVVTDIDAHLGRCPGCASALEQFRATIRQTGRLRDADVDAVDETVRSELLAAFSRHLGAGT
jgi:anti-sigma factor RsiW